MQTEVKHSNKVEIDSSIMNQSVSTLKIKASNDSKVSTFENQTITVD